LVAQTIHCSCHHVSMHWHASFRGHPLSCGWVGCSPIWHSDMQLTRTSFIWVVFTTIAFEPEWKDAPYIDPCKTPLSLALFAKVKFWLILQNCCVMHTITSLFHLFYLKHKLNI
jgi:hypothetical protein